MTSKWISAISGISLITTCFLAAAAFGQEYGNESDDVAGMSQSDESPGDASDTRDQVNEATSVVRQMKQDPDVERLLRQAKGVFIIPDYGKVAAIVGGEGGQGVVVLRDGATENWTGPAFFDFGGGSVGAEAGVKAGSIAMLIMTDKAADMFRHEDNNWSLDADSGLTVVNYPATGEASAGKGDVIVWSDAEGAFIGADVGISDINRDEEDNAAFYGESTDSGTILSGDTSTERADELLHALPG